MSAGDTAITANLIYSPENNPPLSESSDREDELCYDYFFVNLNELPLFSIFIIISRLFLNVSLISPFLPIYGLRKVLSDRFEKLSTTTHLPFPSFI